MTDLAAVQRLRAQVVNRAAPETLPKLARPGNWYEIRNAQGDGDEPAVLRIYDEIHWLFGVSAEQFADDLAQVTAAKIRVEINSPGGDVFDGIAIYNALRAHPAHVTTRVDGIAASAASVIVQAGDHRQMMSSAQQMIHEAWGVMVGPADAMREFADLLDKENDVIAALYAGRSGKKTADEFRDVMRTDTYLTDLETVEFGLADEIVEPPRQTQTSASTSNRIATTVTDPFDVDDLAARIAAKLVPQTPAPEGGSPSAGQREEPTAPAVDHEQATRLLDVLTLNKEK